MTPEQVWAAICPECNKRDEHPHDPQAGDVCGPVWDAFCRGGLCGLTSDDYLCAGKCPPLPPTFADCPLLKAKTPAP